MSNLLARKGKWLHVSVLAGLIAFSGILTAAERESAKRAVKIVTLGDSITKGVRAGVKPEETFAARLEADLNAHGIAAEVINVGIGGERTDQALKRLEADVISRAPQIVTLMYGTNDSYVDRGATKSRLSQLKYRENLKQIVSVLRTHGIEPILMTEPRWAEDASSNGLGENPNLRLEPFIVACRVVASECDTPLVDHFAHWSDAENRGVNLRDWTTDGCHPNPRGHKELAATMLPSVLEVVEKLTPPLLGFQTKLETVLQHDDGKSLWFHPRLAAMPGIWEKTTSACPSPPRGRGQGEGVENAAVVSPQIPDKHRDGEPAVVMTLQKHLQVSDYYSGLSVMRTDDLGATWSSPNPLPELQWEHEPDGAIVAVADVTPGWHAPTGKMLAIGARVRYGEKGQQLDNKPRSHQTAYAVHDPKTGEWSKWKVLEMPTEQKFNFARCACAQWLVQPDGTLLLPFYFGTSASTPNSVTVVQCTFDGNEIRYQKHGNELVLNVVRGLVEPSIVRFAGRYYLTLRNDVKGYVTVSDDGLHFEPIRPWTFDDGSELGSYNTQQHWLAHSDGLLLVYTRRGAENDHIFRHRAPLFIAQVDAEALHVMRCTERVLIPERGATLGNFGAAAINARESWVTVAEGVWNDEARQQGAKGAVFVARVIWSRPNGLIPN